MPATATPRKPQTLARKLVETRNTSRNRGLAAMLGLGESERDAIRSNASAVNDVYGRGTLAGFLGIPGDLGGLMWDAGAAVNNKIKDAEVALGLVSPKQARYVPSGGMAYGGAEHIGQKMQEYGLVSPTRRPVAETLASLISPTGLYATAAKAPQMARAGVRMLDNLAAPRTMGSQTGAIENLWHGSPHTFDRFDLSKIGTGEGAQAYGHGAYLAESPDVANEYYKKFKYKPDAENAIIEYGSAEKARDAAQAKLANPNLPDVERRIYERVISQLDQDGDASLYQTRLAWPDAREATDPLSPDHFLHWDKPLSEQTPYVQDAFNKAIESRRTALTPPEDPERWMSQLMALDSAKGYYTGGGSSKALSASFPMEDTDAMRETSRLLAEQGIPGFRYLDGGSRGAGAGSHNYVVFDDRLIDIVSRNGQPVGNLGKMVAPQDEALRVDPRKLIVSESGDANASYNVRAQEPYGYSDFNNDAPVKVMQLNDGSYYLLDGYHRRRMALGKNAQDIPAISVPVDFYDDSSYDALVKLMEYDNVPQRLIPQRNGQPVK